MKKDRLKIHNAPAHIPSPEEYQEEMFRKVVAVDVYQAGGIAITSSCEALGGIIPSQYSYWSKKIGKSGEYREAMVIALRAKAKEYKKLAKEMAS